MGDEYARMDDWMKAERTPGDLDYVSIYEDALAPVKNKAVGVFNRMSRIRQALDAESGQVPGEDSLLEVAFEEPRARVAYRIDTVYEDHGATYLQRDKFVLAGEAEEVTEGDLDLEDVPAELEIGYASDDWRVLEDEELDEPVGNNVYAYRNL